MEGIDQVQHSTLVEPRKAWSDRISPGFLQAKARLVASLPLQALHPVLGTLWLLEQMGTRILSHDLCLVLASSILLCACARAGSMTYCTKWI